MRLSTGRSRVTETLSALALANRASSLDSGARSERAVFSGGGISSGRSELARWPFFSGGGSERADFSEQNHTQIAKTFRPAAPKWGRRPSFDLRRAPQAGSGGVEAFLGENCPNPRDLSATSPAPEAFLAMPQHVIFAFRFQNELALFFFWGQNELAQFSSEGRFELALFFFWADFGFLLRPFRASSLS